MCPFYNAQLFEITGAAKGVFTRSQSSCHIAKVVLTIRHDSRQIPIASDARPFHTSRGFLHWRFAYAGPTVCAAPPSWGRHPQTFTIPDSCTATKFVLFATSLPRLSIGCAITGLIATAVSNHARRPADVWSNADSWVAKPSQAVQYRRD